MISWTLRCCLSLLHNELSRKVCFTKMEYPGLSEPADKPVTTELEHELFAWLAESVDWTRFGSDSICLPGLECVFVCNNAGKFVFQDCKSSEISSEIGISPDRTILEIVSNRLQRLFLQAFSHTEKGATSRFRYRLTVGSKTKDFKVVLRPFFSNGQFSGVVGSVLDVYVQDSWRRELLARADFSSRLLSTFPYPIVVQDPDTCIKYVNPAFEQMTGYSRLEAINVKAPHPWWLEDRLDKTITDLRCAMRKGAERLLECFEKKDGTKFWVEVSSTPVKHKGKLKYYLACWKDVTSERQLRENMHFYTAKITATQEEERKRISRELHDTVAQDLSRIGLYVDKLLKNNLNSSQNTEFTLEQLRVDISKMLDETYRIIHRLRPETLDHLGLVPSIRVLADDLMVESGIGCRVEVAGCIRSLPPEAELLIYRIIQEAMSNITRHSGATDANIIVGYDPTEIQVTVADNGSGFELPDFVSDFARKAKFGLIGIHERAILLGGKLRVQSQPGEGTKLMLTIKK